MKQLDKKIISRLILELKEEIKYLRELLIELDITNTRQLYLNELKLLKKHSVKTYKSLKIIQNV